MSRRTISVKAPLREKFATATETQAEVLAPQTFEKQVRDIHLKSKNVIQTSISKVVRFQANKYIYIYIYTYIYTYIYIFLIYIYFFFGELEKGNLPQVHSRYCQK